LEILEHVRFACQLTHGPAAVDWAWASHGVPPAALSAPPAARQPLGPFLVELLAHPGYHLGSAARCSPVSLHFAALFHG